MKKLYVIGKIAPEGATEEHEITHYKIAKSLKDAKAGIGTVVERRVFMEMLTPYVEMWAYNSKDGHKWKLRVANTNEQKT